MPPPAGDAPIQLSTPVAQAGVVLCPAYALREGLPGLAVAHPPLRPAAYSRPVGVLPLPSSAPLPTLPDANRRPEGRLTQVGVS